MFTTASKSGPNYCPPGAAGRRHLDRRRRQAGPHRSGDLSRWWEVFNDPVLNGLVYDAYHQNLTLREAGFRVLEARAQLAISIGNIFPQTQTASGILHPQRGERRDSEQHLRLRNSGHAALFQPVGFRVQPWLGARFLGPLPPRDRVEPRQLSSASVADYDDVLVTLLGDVATNYVQFRTSSSKSIMPASTSSCSGKR